MKRTSPRPFGAAAIGAIAAGALGFALALCAGLAAGVRPDAALVRALAAGAIFAAAGFTAVALVHRPAPGDAEVAKDARDGADVGGAA
jgi:hypothetical protein